MTSRLMLASLLLAAACLASAGETLAPAEDLFKWGEYDSLIRVLEPATATSSGAVPANASDSLVRAKSYLFLGVAFYATGKPQRADEAFTMACALDPQVKLDRFYVTEEIANHFQAIALDGVRRSTRKAALTTLNADATRAMDAPRSAARTPALRRKDDHAWVWWGLAAGAVVAAGGGAYLLAHGGDTPSDNVTVIDPRKPK